MKIALTIFLISSLINLSIMAYFLIRNECVYRFRIKVLDEYNHEKYLSLPSYDDMLVKYFYEWNFNKFIDMGEKE